MDIINESYNLIDYGDKTVISLHDFKQLVQKILPEDMIDKGILGKIYEGFTKRAMIESKAKQPPNSPRATPAAAKNTGRGGVFGFGLFSTNQSQQSTSARGSGQTYSL